MRAGARQVEPVDAAERPRREPLLQQLGPEHLAVEDVAALDAEAGLELLRAEREAIDDPVRERRADLGESGDGQVGRLRRLDVGREALAEEGEHVAAVRREAPFGVEGQTHVRADEQVGGCQADAYRAVHGPGEELRRNAAVTSSYLGHAEVV